MDKETIQRASAGDVDAFEIIYKEYFNHVAGMALRVVNRREDAEEITQDVFMTIFRSLKNFRFESSLKTWIYRVTYNTAINHAKKNSKHHDRAVEYTEALNVHAPVDNTAGDASGNINEDQVARLLEAATPEQRACLALRGLEGLSYQEIAAALQIPINTVRSRIKRGREILLAARKEGIKNAV